jgi:hypothetical protein
MQVGNCIFVLDDGIRDMAREMEEIYAAVFGTRLHLFCAYFYVLMICLISQLPEIRRRLVSNYEQGRLSKLIISVHFDRACSPDVPFLLSSMDFGEVSILTRTMSMVTP